MINTYKDSICLEYYIIQPMPEKKQPIIEVIDGEEMKLCNSCGKFKPRKGFFGKRCETTKCGHCLKLQTDRENRRPKRNRKEYNKEYESRPDCRDRRKQNRLKNPEKYASYYMNYRKRQLETNEEEYLKRNRENAKKWRKEHPTEYKKLQEKRKINMNDKLKTSKYRANRDGIEWKLTDEEAVNMFKSKCYYCGDPISDENLNGIDRLDNATGYIKNNCVSCCSMCNYMKGCLTEEVFIKRCIHIATFNGLIKGKLFLNAFIDTYASEFSNYRITARNKKLVFKITKEQYDELIKGDCYICGKNTTDKHINGIDRFDNNFGYIKGNVKSCCNNCNVMKRDYPHYMFLNKCYKIANKFLWQYIKKPDDIYPNEKNIKAMDRKKITREELDERKKERQNELEEYRKNTIMNEKYVEQHAREIGEKHNQKNINILEKIEIDNENDEFTNNVKIMSKRRDRKDRIKLIDGIEYNIPEYCCYETEHKPYGDRHRFVIYIGKSRWKSSYVEKISVKNAYKDMLKALKHINNPDEVPLPESHRKKPKTNVLPKIIYDIFGKKFTLPLYVCYETNSDGKDEVYEFIIKDHPNIENKSVEIINESETIDKFIEILIKLNNGTKDFTEKINCVKMLVKINQYELQKLQKKINKLCNN